MISKEKLIELYSAMVMCRMIAERARRLAHEVNVACGLDAALGREATIAGVAVDLHPEDTLKPTREVMVSRFLAGLPLDRLFAHAARSSNGHAHFEPGADADAPAEEAAAAATTDLDSACHAAKEHKAARDGRVTIAFCDAEQTHPSRLRRSLSAASKSELPIIFVRQREGSNGKEERPTRRAGRATPPAALEFGVPVIEVDGSDVLAVYRVASESIARARQRSGATVIDCIAGRGGEWLVSGRNGAADPIAVMESHLAGRGLFHRALRQKITEGFEPELERATRSLAH